VPVNNNQTFLELLKKAKPFIPANDIKKLEQRYGSGSLAMLEALIAEGILTHTEATNLWSDSIRVAYVDPLSSVVTRESLDLIPAAIARKAQVIGLYVITDVLTVALSDPTNQSLLNRLEGITGMKVSPVFSLPSEIKAAIDIDYSSDQDVGSIIRELSDTSQSLLQEFSDLDFQALSETKSLIKIVDALFYFAMRERASDIHIEPQPTESVVRFRIDGRLRKMLKFSKTIHRAILCRIKVMSDMNIAESRFPQDGRMSMPLGPRQADFRVSIIPSIEGEKAVIRILASTGRSEMMTLDKMLISQTVIHPFKRILHSPSGIIFVTGPTGSGKSTTLYASLHEIAKPDINISTIEDPVEIRMDGITQSQVNNHIDLKFSMLLRAMLRQDPDVILVGEIRDLETAKIATEAALTGHLVFATLHTNNAIQAVVRLVEIGIEPYMVAPSVQAVLGQRLMARICERCKEVYYPSSEELSKYFHDAVGISDIPFYLGKGCRACRQSGYHGRVAIHELVMITEPMRSLISQNAGQGDLTRMAKASGYRPLRYDALKKALLGLTTIEEVERSTSFEWSA